MMTTETVGSLRYKGCIYRIPFAPFESMESAYRRGWYVAKQQPKCTADGMRELWCQSHKWLNSTYLKMVYHDRKGEVEPEPEPGTIVKKSAKL